MALVCATLPLCHCATLARERDASPATRHRSFHPPPPPHAVRTSVAGGAARLCEQAAGDEEPHFLAFLSARLRADEPCARAGASALRRAGEKKGWGWGACRGPVACEGRPSTALAAAPATVVRPKRASGLGRRRGGPGGRPDTPGARRTAPGVRRTAPGVRRKASGVRQRIPGVRQKTPGVRQKSSGGRQRTPGVRQYTPGVRQKSPYGPLEKSDVRRTRREVAVICDERAAKSRKCPYMRSVAPAA